MLPSDRGDELRLGTVAPSSPSGGGEPRGSASGERRGVAPGAPGGAAGGLSRGLDPDAPALFITKTART